MKSFFITIPILFFSFSFSQNKTDKLKAISILESLSYEEVYLMGFKYINTMKINYNEDSNKIEIIQKSFNPRSFSTHSLINIFYLDDLNLETLKDQTFEVNNGLFSPGVIVHAKGKIIENIEVNEDKNDLTKNYKKTEYSDVLAIYPGMKSLPKEHAAKFVKNVIILLQE